MAMEPLPNGFEDFSIAMDPSQASLWPLPTTTTLGQDDLRCCRPLEGVEKVKQLLAAATAELQAASEELRRKEQNIAALVDLGRDTAKERDLLLEQQHLLARELEAITSSSSDSGWSALPPSPAPVAVDGSAMFKPFAMPSPAADGSEDRSTATALEVPRFAAVVAEHRCTAAALDVPRFAVVTGEDRSMAAVLALKAPKFAAVVHEDTSKVAALEQLAAKRPLPQKGRMLQAVMDAGPLLQNLMVVGSLPKWRNPPRTQALANAMIPAPSVSGAHMGLPRSTH